MFGWSIGQLDCSLEFAFCTADEDQKAPDDCSKGQVCETSQTNTTEVPWEPLGTKIKPRSNKRKDIKERYWWSHQKLVHCELGMSA